MLQEQAMEAVGILSGRLTGFNDASVVAYVEDFTQLHDFRALTKACEQVSRTWLEGRRPPIAVILDAYNRELSRKSDIPRGIDTRYPTFEEGIEIAWQAYCAEVRRLGREPDRRKFEKWLPV
jgi:hypothetical protein